MSVNTEIPVDTLEPERILELILSALGDLIEYELAVVLGLDGRNVLSVRKAAGPLANERLSRYSINLRDRGDLASILERGEPHLFSEDEDHVDTYEGIIDLPHGHSCLVAPLSVAGTRIGLLTLDHRSCGRFTPGLVRFIGSMATLISLSVAQSDERAKLQITNADLVRQRNALLTPGYEPIAGLVGSSAAWIRAVESLRLAADADVPVLILGETGTGKELAARSVHRLSARAGGPFVALNCSALAPSLAESELFGHERGSFTGASGQRRGRFELADGGTLFLDEIGDLPLELQPKLLRVLQEGSLERLGGERTVRVNVRIVAATHVDLEAAVRSGRFREDLYYRLGVFPVRLPPLRERPGDALLLAELFLSEIQKRPGFGSVAMDADAAAILDTLSWPGNVRELRNVIERAAILARGAMISPVHLGIQAAPADSPPPKAGGHPRTLADAQREAIENALARSHGRLYGTGGAAELLGMKPSTLQSRMKKLGITSGGSRRKEVDT
ncbi:MAG: sigma 54-interacting transcriptional regulator [Spirochaetia bacterium]|nr:sigma 54-interacting transcriptional regulator [Spirochaetia bacterium]